MRGRADPLRDYYKKGGLHSKRLDRPQQEPTESQVKAVDRICDRLGIRPPEVYTKQSYTQFISNHSGTKEGHRRARNDN